MQREEVVQQNKFGKGFFDDVSNFEVQNLQVFDPDPLSGDEAEKIQVCSILQEIKTEIKEIEKISIPKQDDPQEDSVLKSEKNEEQTKAPLCKNKSIFHNLQKHLVAFLKRAVVLKRVDLIRQPQGLNAYELWKLFRDGKSCTKKSLYIIVGLASTHNKENMIQMSSFFPVLKKMMQKYPFQQIEQSQTLLRETIASFLIKLPEHKVRQQCRMNSFDELYSYLTAFINELRGEGLTMRMKKQQKIKLMSKHQ